MHPPHVARVRPQDVARPARRCPPTGRASRPGAAPASARRAARSAAAAPAAGPGGAATGEKLITATGDAGPVRRLGQAEPVQQLDQPLLDQPGVPGRVLGLDQQPDRPAGGARRASSSRSRVSTGASVLSRSSMNARRSAGGPRRRQLGVPGAEVHRRAGRRGRSRTPPRARTRSGRPGGRARRPGGRPGSAGRRTPARPRPPRSPAGRRRGCARPPRTRTRGARRPAAGAGRSACPPSLRSSYRSWSWTSIRPHRPSWRTRTRSSPPNAPGPGAAWHAGLGMYVTYGHAEADAVLRDRRLGRLWALRWPAESLAGVHAAARALDAGERAAGAHPAAPAGRGRLRARPGGAAAAPDRTAVAARAGRRPVRAPSTCCRRTRSRCRSRSSPPCSGCRTPTAGCSGRGPTRS